MSGPPRLRARRLLLVSHRPVDFGGGGSVRWRYLMQALPDHGWHVTSVSARVNITANEASTDPRLAKLAEARARVTQSAGDLVRPVFVAAGVQPEAFAPNLLWAFTGRRAIRRAIEQVRPDVIWATGPPFSAIPAAVSAGRRLELPVVAEFRDLWAGNPYFDAGGRLLRRLEANPLRQADAVVTVTPGCIERLLSLHPELGPRLHLLPNGFDPSVAQLRDANRSRRGRPAVLIHAGSLYGDRTAVSLIRALSGAALRKQVRLALVGPVDPATTAAAQAAADRLDVSIHPPVDWAEALERMAKADICIVINSSRTGGSMALPSKLFEALAIGRPVLALTPAGSDSERLLTRLGQAQGIARSDDEDGMVAAVQRLLDDAPPPVPLAALADYDRETVAKRICELLERLSSATREEARTPVWAAQP